MITKFKVARHLLHDKSWGNGERTAVTSLDEHAKKASYKCLARVSFGESIQLFYLLL